MEAFINSSIQTLNLGVCDYLKCSEQEHPSLNRVVVSLENGVLWENFSRLNTEMIVTKTGRRMFPTLQFRIEDVNANSKYLLVVEFEPCDLSRYRYSFHSSSWVQSGKGDPPHPKRSSLHPDGLCNGMHWKRSVINFDKLKLTNNIQDKNGHVVLNSMHKYRPRLHVVLLPDEGHAERCYFYRTFQFEQTSFYAVTAYQNHRVRAITQLKIASNPFAKGFRDCDPEDCVLEIINHLKNPHLKPPHQPLCSTLDHKTRCLFKEKGKKRKAEMHETANYPIISHPIPVRYSPTEFGRQSNLASSSMICYPYLIPSCKYDGYDLYRLPQM